MFKSSMLLRRFCSPFPYAVALFSIVLPSNAIPLSPSGKVVAVVQATTASGPGGRRTLSVAKPIFSGDTIRTGAVGNAQLKFNDNTRFVIGPRSNVVIDKYVFNPNRTLAGASITMARGAFRFMSGNGPKRAYKIKTPTATIGIRGTQVDVAVGRGVGTAVLVFRGAVQLCSNRSGQCKLVRSGCGAAIASPNGNVDNVGRGTRKSNLIRTSFPLTRQQGRLPRGFRVNTGGCDEPATRSQRASVAPTARTQRVSAPRFEDTPVGISPGTPGVSGSTFGTGAPGASGRTSGGRNSAASNASDTARSGPGNSASSNAGGNGNAGGFGSSGRSADAGSNSSAGGRSGGRGNGNSNGNGNGNGR